MARGRFGDGNFHEQCRLALETLWRDIIAAEPGSVYSPQWRETVYDLLRSPRGMSSTYRFVLPTQLLAKYVDATRNARAVQKGAESDAASFDARSLASAVIVPFNRVLGSPLGDAADPYVNNPLRVPEISPAYRAQQRDKPRWDSLCALLEFVESANSPEITEQTLKQTLAELRVLIEETTIRYPIPQRIDQDSANDIIQRFLKPRTGGRRLQAVCVALFRTIADRFGIYDEVLSSSITSADAPGDRPSDIECRLNGQTVLAVEVKDQTLTLELLEDKIRSARLARVRELMFLIRATPLVGDSAVVERVRREFSSGQNIYLLPAETFLAQVLALVGEQGRVTFLEQTGDALDTLGLDYTDRRAWAELLSSI